MGSMATTVSEPRCCGSASCFRANARPLRGALPGVESTDVLPRVISVLSFPFLLLFPFFSPFTLSSSVAVEIDSYFELLSL